MPAKTVIVGSAIGLHARPAAIIAEAVVSAGVPVTLSMDGGEPVDAGSALMIMTLGAGNGAEVTVASDDEDACLEDTRYLVSFLPSNNLETPPRVLPTDDPMRMDEALDTLDAQGLHLDTLRIRAFPFHDEVLDFIAGHERVFVVEQNRDAQMRSLLTIEGEIDPARLVPILHYDGTPITARFIVKAIADMLAVVTLAPLKKALP